MSSAPTMHPGAQDLARPAILDPARGETVSFAELDASANRASRLFRELGLDVGDHVAMCLETSGRFLEILWGAHYAGLLYTACSTRLGAEELAYIVEDCDAEVMILSARYAALAPTLDAATPRVRHRLSLGGPIDGYEPFETLAAAQSPEPLHELRIAGRDMLYSSGTTGRPKGVVPNVLISHPAVLDAAVFGVPDEEWGERVVAVVQPLAMPADAAGATALVRELSEHCRGRLADVKCPRSVELRPELPRHETGKLYKRGLREQFLRAGG